MGEYKVGIRVGALSHSEDSTIYVFGYGTYEGDHVPGDEVIGPFGANGSEMGANPRIKLDSGDVVWGCECWWGPEEEIKAVVAKFETVKTIPVPDRSEQGEAQG